ncbi:MAG: hypothetical protein GX847_06195 [Clostridiales bacterium]|nr:hypothetical protein [Clostridiales bacterium]
MKTYSAEVGGDTPPESEAEAAAGEIVELMSTFFSPPLSQEQSNSRTPRTKRDAGILFMMTAFLSHISSLLCVHITILIQQLEERLVHITKYRKKSAWTAALTLTLALLLVGCAATIGVPSVSSYEPESSVPSGDSTEAGAHESFTGNNVEKAFSDDARIVVEKQNGIYIVYVLDDLSVKITGEGQYDISYKVGTGVALMMGASDTYIPQDPYMPLLATDRNFENLIDIANIDPRNTVHYTSDGSNWNRMISKRKMRSSRIG